MQSDGPVLTIDALLDMASRMEAIGPHRIISGAPIVASDRALEFLRRRVLFIGDGVIDALRREGSDARSYIGRPEYRLEFLGIQIEPYGSRPDHREIMIDLVREMSGEKPFTLLDGLEFMETPFDDSQYLRMRSMWINDIATGFAAVGRGFATMSLACADTSDAISQLTDAIKKASHDMDRKPASRRSIGRRKW